MNLGSIVSSFRHPAQLLKALRLRWPNPIQARMNAESWYVNACHRFGVKYLWKRQEG